MVLSIAVTEGFPLLPLFAPEVRPLKCRKRFISQILPFFLLCLLLAGSGELYSQQLQAGKKGGQGMQGQDAFPPPDDEDEEDGTGRSRVGRIHFSDLLPLGENDIGIYALFQEQPSPDVWVGSGYVDIRFKDTRLQADKITLYLLTNDVVAEGNVVFGHPGQQVTGQRATINIETGLGTIWESTGFFSPGIYVTAEQLDYYQTDWVRTGKATFTSCDQPTPDWSFRVKKSRLHLENYAWLTYPRFAIKNATLVPLPYLIWPIKTERSSGFLFPSIGMSQNRGFHVGVPFFWVISDSADAELRYDYYTKWGNGFGAIARYYVGQFGSGFFDGYLLQDKIDDTTRWKVEYQHLQDLLYDWRIGVDVDLNSDWDFNREYSSDYASFGRRSTSAQGYASRSWSNYSFNAVFQTIETSYESGGFSDVVRRELPSIDFEGRKQRLWGSPVYFEFNSRYGNLYIQDYRNERQFNRLDLSPIVSMPIKKISWLKINPEIGYRYTYYDHQVPLDKDGNGIQEADLLKEDLTRRYFFSTVEFIGPSFSKIFDTPRSFYSSKIKHLIEPQFSYNYISPVNNLASVPYFDYGDTVLEVNEVQYALVNRLFAKRKITEEGQPVSHEFLTLEISQKYSVDPELSTSYGRQFNPYTGGYYEAEDLIKRTSPWRTRLQIAPTRNFSFDYEIYYDTDLATVVQRRYGIRMRKQDRFFASVSYNDNPLPPPGRETIMGAVGVELFDRRIRAEVATQYHFTVGYRPREQFRFVYFGQCYSFQIEYLNYSYRSGADFDDSLSDRRIEATLTLTHIGDIFRYRDRSDGFGGS